MEKIWDQAQLEEWLVRETGKQQGDSTAPEQVLPNGLLCPLGKVELPAQKRAEMSWSLGPQQCSVGLHPCSEDDEHDSADASWLCVWTRGSGQSSGKTPNSTASRQNSREGGRDGWECSKQSQNCRTINHRATE